MSAVKKLYFILILLGLLVTQQLSGAYSTHAATFGKGKAAFVMEAGWRIEQVENHLLSLKQDGISTNAITPYMLIEDAELLLKDVRGDLTALIERRSADWIRLVQVINWKLADAHKMVNEAQNLSEALVERD